MTIKSLSPRAAHDLLKEGAVLLDIRNADEHARERITQARHLPMDRLHISTLPTGGAPAVIFHCRSGHRTRMNAPQLEAWAGCDAYVIEGGLDAWKKAGLPVVEDKSRPLELQRQVQIAAGSLIVLGAVTGATISPWFHLLSGIVGAGLVFAGVSGFCGLARVLMHMPWNRNAMASET
ncbi:rhodanese family protein [Variovorax sp. VNK109]|jgi:rhodanese-related sulfurtransferase|uniref:rhodanese family protein n=1 Tax=Variovorax sp. VNK109 TaxID=3400919 RepID=UPI003C012CF8